MQKRCPQDSTTGLQRMPRQMGHEYSSTGGFILVMLYMNCGASTWVSVISKKTHMYTYIYVYILIRKYIKKKKRTATPALECQYEKRPTMRGKEIYYEYSSTDGFALVLLYT